MSEAEAYMAGWVIPGKGLPLQGGCVIIEKGLIKAVLTPEQIGRDLDSTIPVYNFSHAYLLPGLINLHTHLILSEMDDILPRGDLLLWMRSLRKKLHTWGPETFNHSLHTGLLLSIAEGTTCIADIYSPHVDPGEYLDSKIRAVVFPELIGLQEARSEKQFSLYMKNWKKLIRAFQGVSRISLGVSIHAPYSVSGRLLELASDWANVNGLLAQIHISEFKGESEFLYTGRGVYRNHLNLLGRDLGDWSPPGVGSIKYLQNHGLLGPRTLLVHGTYLTKGELSMILNSGAKLIYCPGSNAFFGSPVLPIWDLWDRGLCIGIGTDSLASNRGLNLIDELKLIASASGTELDEVRAARLLRAVTCDAAEFLSMNDRIGVIAPGMMADMTIIETGEKIAESEPNKALLQASKRCVLRVIVEGRCIYRNDG